MLRDNNIDYLVHQNTSIKLFTDKLLKMKEDGYAFASPVYYWKRKVEDDWKAGGVHYDLKQHLRVGGRLAYQYLSLLVSTEFEGSKVCLDVMVAALRHGMACLHPKINKEGIRVYENSQPQYKYKLGRYTLSGCLRVSNLI